MDKKQPKEKIAGRFLEFVADAIQIVKLRIGFFIL
jgi:hypothetical protein